MGVRGRNLAGRQFLVEVGIGRDIAEILQLLDAICVCHLVVLWGVDRDPNGLQGVTLEERQ